MAVKVVHRFRSAKPDGADASVIRPSNWNEDHVITMATSRVLGRFSPGAGGVEEISIGQGLGLTEDGILYCTVSGGGGGSTNAATLGGQEPSYYTNIPARLGYTPVVSDNPGRLRLQWGGDAQPYLIVDNTPIRLAMASNLDATNKTAGDAYSFAVDAYQGLRMVNQATMGAGNVPSGCVVTGVNGGVVTYRYLQGYSPKRGWLNAFNEG